MTTLARRDAQLGAIQKVRLWIKWLSWPGINWVSREKSALRHILLRASEQEAIRTLDVGCGNGYFTYQAAMHGTRALGITPDPGEVGRCEEMRAFLGVPDDRLGFLQASLDDLASEAQYRGAFDQILMLDVIEHIRDDRKALDHAYSLLNKDGFLLVSVPNRDFELSRKEPHVSRHERGWHVRHGYTFAQLEALMEEAGFEPIDRRRYGSVGSKLAVLIQKRLGLRRNAGPGVLTLPLLGALSLALSWFKDPHTLLVIARCKGAHGGSEAD